MNSGDRVKRKKKTFEQWKKFGLMSDEDTKKAKESWESPIGTYQGPLYDKCAKVLWDGSNKEYCEVLSDLEIVV